jgi:hypothetical protein
VAIIVSFMAASLIAVVAILWAVMDEAATAPWGLIFAPFGVFIGGIATALPSIGMALLLERLSLSAGPHLGASIVSGAILGSLFSWLMFNGESVFPAFAAVFAAAGMASGWTYHRIIYAHR